jgi:hypothetical protein
MIRGILENPVSRGTYFLFITIHNQHINLLDDSLMDDREVSASLAGMI